MENIKQATEKLTQAFYEVSEKLYKQASAANAANAGATADAGANTDAGSNGENPEGTVYDAEYVENDGDKQ